LSLYTEADFTRGEGVARVVGYTFAQGLVINKEIERITVGLNG
jgi:hypothetical protein